MKGAVKQIIGSFEDIGKDIAREAASVPKDVVGKALESLGTSSQKGSTAGPMQPASVNQSEGALGEFGKTDDQKVKQAIAREALAQLAGSPKKEQSIHERQLEEEQQKKEQKDREAKAASMQLNPMSTKQKRGNLYGIKQKASSEMSKNVRQD